MLQTTTPDSGVQSSRRGVVAGAVASVAAALGLSGTAAGKLGSGRAARLRRVEARYRDEATAVDAIQERGADVLAQLAEEDYLDRGDVAELGAPEVNAIESQGTFTGHVRAETEVDAGTLAVVVEPEADRQYAILDHDDRDEATVFDGGDVKPMCHTGTGCAGGGCVCDAYEVVQCPDGDCYTNGPTGGTCSSCKACGSPACGW